MYDFSSSDDDSHLPPNLSMVMSGRSHNAPSLPVDTVALPPINLHISAPSISSMPVKPPHQRKRKMRSGVIWSMQLVCQYDSILTAV
jgi:hypothetical protein